MEWTRKNPTAPGWYWNKAVWWPDQPAIVEVYHDTKDVLYATTGDGTYDEKLENWHECFWCGPLEAPPLDRSKIPS